MRIEGLYRISTEHDDPRMNSMKNRKLYRTIAGICLLFLLLIFTVCALACMEGNGPASNEDDTTDSLHEELTSTAPHESDPFDEFGSDPIQDTEETVSEETEMPPETSQTEMIEETTELPETQAPAPEELLFEQYQALNGSEQYEYFLSFPAPEDFFAWYNAAVKDYQERNPGVEIGPDGLVPLP